MACVSLACDLPRTAVREMINRYANSMHAHADGVEVKQVNVSFLPGQSLIPNRRTRAACATMADHFRDAKRPAMALLTRDFYDRGPVEVARDLIGKRLIRRTSHGLCSGVIVETEAYLAADDPASHSFRGRTRKNATMFGRAGLLYVYPIHGRCCLNAVTESRGIASAVLIRSAMPLQGIELMQQRRQCVPSDLARGPARLCEALAVDRRLDGWDLTRGTRIWIEQPDDAEDSAQEIVMSSRIGVTSGHDLELRFFLKDNPYVSGPRMRNALRVTWDALSRRRTPLGD